MVSFANIVEEPSSVHETHPRVRADLFGLVDDLLHGGLVDLLGGLDLELNFEEHVEFLYANTWNKASGVSAKKVPTVLTLCASSVTACSPSCLHKERR